MIIDIQRGLRIINCLFVCSLVKNENKLKSIIHITSTIKKKMMKALFMYIKQTDVYICLRVWEWTSKETTISIIKPSITSNQRIPFIRDMKCLIILATRNMTNQHVFMLLRQYVCNSSDIIDF